MYTNGKPQTVEISMKENNSNSVVVEIPDKVTEVNAPFRNVSIDTKFKDCENSPHRVSIDSSDGVAVSSPTNARSSPKPPKFPTRQQSFTILAVQSKPKSRFGEQSLSIDSDKFEEIPSSSFREQVEQNSNSPLTNTNASPNAPKMPLTTPTPTTVKDTLRSAWLISKKPTLVLRKMVWIECVAFVCIMGVLVASLTVQKLENSMLWGLEIWKWCVLITVVFFGKLITERFMHFVAFLFKLNLFWKNVLHFVHGFKKSLEFCIWFGSLLIAWVMLFNNQGVKRSATAIHIFDGVTWTIASMLIGTFMWLLKNVMIKILSSSFHVHTFFERIQQSIIHHYILQTLSPCQQKKENEEEETNTSVRLTFWRMLKGKEEKEKVVIDVDKIDLMNSQEKVSAWTKIIWVDLISNSGLPTISNDSHYDGGDKEITSEKEARAAASLMFSNVAQPHANFIDKRDLSKYMIKEEVDLVIELIDKAETGKIELKALEDWVVKAFEGRKAIAYGLSDTKTAVKEMNKLVTGIMIVVVIIVWLLLMEIATTKLLLFFSSQLVVAAFVFGNTCKTIFEAIIFVFVMHPFDVGDRCVIDGVQLIVEEVKIFTTVFLKYDKEMIYYPNSVLASKPISNFYRSPHMSDSLEFSIDFSTPAKDIEKLKDAIKTYLKDNPLYWHPNHNVVVKEIENVNKIKMVLIFNHTMNFQDFGEKNKRRSELVIKMKQIFEELKIKYNLLPQEINLVKP